MLEKIRDILVEQLDVNREDITSDTDFSSLGADSIDLFEVVLNLEEEYSISISPEDLEKIETVGDILDYLADRGIEE